MASGSYDGMVRRWDVRTGAPIGQPLRGHVAAVISVAYSPDGRWIASAGGDVWLWDALTGKIACKPLNVQSGEVYSVAFSPDGTTLVSGSKDGTIRLWQCIPGPSDDRSRLPTSRLPTTPIAHPQGMLTLPDSSSSIQHKLLASTFPPREALHLSEDGWILGPNNELLLWLPEGLRCIVPLSERGIIDNIDFTNFKCGTEWSDCWSGDWEAQTA